MAPTGTAQKAIDAAGRLGFAAASGLLMWVTATLGISLTRPWRRCSLSGVRCRLPSALLRDAMLRLSHAADRTSGWPTTHCGRALSTAVCRHASRL